VKRFCPLELTSRAETDEAREGRGAESNGGRMERKREKVY
jgi:hypothetical protein